ncbi:HesA/MoeB/ThiF family protein [Candidatus Bathyarchaeota archaeon]|nr:HesA/MoeB/ThiF family protein [Candidatus Bathyarchaeota archaeon]
MARYDMKNFTDKEVDYYSRQIMLKNMGFDAQRKLKESTVCIVGVGGLGSPVAIQLASMGVGTLRLIDNDIVEMSNLQRQHLYGVDQVGLPKVEAAAHRLRGLNPFIRIDPVPMMVTPFNAEELIDGSDVVIGSLDMMAPRYSLNRACQRLGIPFIHGAALAYNGTVSTILPAKTACLECFQGGIDDSEMPTCATVGVHPAILGIVGSLVVAETVRIIIGQEPNLADKLMFLDLEDHSFETINLRKAENCPVCGETDKVPEPVTYDPITEICGREGRRVFIFNPEHRMDLSLEDVNTQLNLMGFNVVMKGELGSTFEGPDGVKGSILKTGVAILEGFKEQSQAVKTHKRIFSTLG